MCVTVSPFSLIYFARTVATLQSINSNQRHRHCKRQEVELYRRRLLIITTIQGKLILPLGFSSIEIYSISKLMSPSC